MQEQEHSVEVILLELASQSPGSDGKPLPPQLSYRRHRSLASSQVKEDMSAADEQSWPWPKATLG